MTTETHCLTIGGRDLEIVVSDNSFRAELADKAALDADDAA